MPTTVFFATNRGSLGGEPPRAFDDGPSAANGRVLRFGTALVDAASQKSEVEIHTAREALSMEDPRERIFGSREILDALRTEVGDGSRPVVIYVHGFRNSFAEAMRDAAEMGTALKATVFAFSWPSKDSVAGYYPDQQAAEYSGRAIARAFDIFLRWLEALKRKDRCRARVHLVAHSMGNRAIRFALQAMPKVVAGEAPAILDQALLVAADDDADALERWDKLRPLCTIARAVSVYHSPRDLALQVSDRFKLNPNRLGTNGPLAIGNTADNVFAIDVSGVLGSEDSFTSHSFHRTNARVMEDIRRVIGQPGPTHVEGRRPMAEVRRFRLE